MTLTNFRGEPVTIVTDDSRDALLSDFGKTTLSERYLLPGETFQGLFARVAAAFSDDQAHAQRIYDYISKHWFMPATPVLSNGGTDRGLPISCFLNSVPDSMVGIRDIYSENIDLASNGGGIGTCWTGVRSLDEKIRERGKTSGIIPFIKVQDSLTLGVSQGSLRRGSAAVYLDISHPEIEEFLDLRRVKGDPNRRSLNLHHGITIPDAFMRAVENNEDWNLVSPKDGSIRKTVSARSLWQKALITRLEEGEPYFVFIDTVNRNSSPVYQKLGLKVRQSNLCSEIALATGMDHLGNERTAVCCLSSLVMSTMDEWFGNEEFLYDVACFLDNVLEDFIRRTEGQPGFAKARYAAMRERSVGLGVMGFHTYLQKKGMIYESALAHSVNLRLFNWLSAAGERINERGANERGACPDAVDAGLNVRWTHLYSIAPTASISIIAAAGGTTSASVEPFPANVYIAKTLDGSFEVRNAELDKVIEKHARVRLDIFPDLKPAELDAMVRDYKEQAWKQVSQDEGSVKNLNFLSQDEKDTFKTFIEIDQRWVVSHAAARAKGKFFQMASNNISLPGDVHKRDLHELHMKAWRDGVPSLYYLRSKSIQRGQKAGTTVTHVAGEMPQPKPAHEVVLQDRGVAPEPIPVEKSYDECLACQ